MINNCAILVIHQSLIKTILILPWKILQSRTKVSSSLEIFHNFPQNNNVHTSIERNGTIYTAHLIHCKENGVRPKHEKSTQTRSRNCTRSYCIAIPTPTCMAINLDFLERFSASVTCKKHHDSRSFEG